MSWAAKKVIESAGIRMEDATPEILALAEIALERCYYIDRAAQWLIERLDAKRWR
jgi:hypothetical protein